MTKKTVTIRNDQGLHARPAQLIATLAMTCKCEIKALKNGDENKIYNPKSILSLMGMGAMKGDNITFIAEGEDEEEALNKIVASIEDDFDE